MAGPHRLTCLLALSSVAVALVAGAVVAPWLALAGMPGLGILARRTLQAPQPGSRRPGMVAPATVAVDDGAVASVEAELKVAVGAVGEQAEATVARIGEVATALDEISTRTGSMRATAQANAEAAAEVEAANEELKTAIANVDAAASNTAAVAKRAVTAADEAGEAMGRTREAAREIESIAAIIADIADRTNLLALNATIEAARAGEAGRGFAVVAGEVKQLAAQTAEATRRIGAQIEAIGGTVATTAGRIDTVVASIRSIDAAAGAALDATEVQARVADRIAGATARAVAHTGTLTADIANVAESAARSASGAGRVTAQARESARVVDRLGADAVVCLRQTARGDRRRHPRTPCEFDAELRFGDNVLVGRTRDLSLGGALVGLDRGTAPAGNARGRLDLQGVGAVAVEVRDVGTMGLHLAFTEIAPEVEAKLVELLAAVVAEDMAFAGEVKAGARAIEAALEAAVAGGRVSVDDLFDVDYAPVSGSDPQQFTTRFTELCDALLPPIQEPLLAGSDRIVFAAAMDRNAYLPTHNRAVSHPQRPNDPVWNAANCRNRRKFDDRAGLAAARNTKPVLLQSYARDMGNGRTVMLKEVDAPVSVRGRHWGCLRLAYRLR